MARRKKSSIFVALGRGMMTKFSKEEETFEFEDVGTEQGNTIYLFHLANLLVLKLYQYLELRKRNQIYFQAKHIFK